MDILDETIKNLNEEELEDTEKFGDAIELECSECKTVTRFYYVDIQPYIDFYQEEFKYPDEIKCPICRYT